MLPKEMSKYYRTQVDIATVNFLSACKRPAVNPIHDFRVAVKRIRTFIKTFRQTLPGALDNVKLKKLLRVYRAAGRIRDSHVQLELIDATMKKSQEPLKRYVDHLSKMLRDGEEQFEHESDRFNLKSFEKIERSIDTAAAKCSEQKITRSVQNYLDHSLHELLKAIDRAERHEREFYRMHEVRKGAKRSRYIVELLQEVSDSPDSLAPLNNQLRNVHRALGRWHDVVIGTRFLARFRRRCREELKFSGGAYGDFRAALQDLASLALLDYDTALEELSHNLASQAIA